MMQSSPSPSPAAAIHDPLAVSSAAPERGQILTDLLGLEEPEEALPDQGVSLA
jgi:hypothetical protein